MYNPATVPSEGMTTTRLGRFSFLLRPSKSQNNEIGHSPFSIVDVLGATARNWPASISFLKKSTPGWGLASSPPLAYADAKTTIFAVADSRGSFMQIVSLYSGLRRSCQVWGTFLTISAFTVKAIAPQ